MTEEEAAVEVAKIELEREITCALIQAAATIFSVDIDRESDAETQKEAANFLASWYARKKPVVEMPNF